MRYAIYFTPPRHHPLTATAERWLQRSAFDGPVAPIHIPGFSETEVAQLTAEPRRYGFHATIKAPFRLAGGTSAEALDEELASFVSDQEPFGVRLKVGRHNGTLALVADGAQPPELDRLAGAVVERFDRFRAPLTPAEIARREPDRLTPSQRRNLDRWGYPYVFEDFRFHMTLTGKMPEEQLDAMQAALEEIFNPVLQQPVEIAALALFTQRSMDSPFFVKRVHAFGAARQSGLASI